MEDADMFEKILEAAGPNLLVPAALFALAFYAARGLFGLHGRKSDQRREFLERWDPNRSNDDLWLEVMIRQLYGTYLPAHVIRQALAQPHSSQALIELSQLWHFIVYDSDCRTVKWAHKKNFTAIRRFLARHLSSWRYALLALGTTLSIVAAYSSHGLTQWTYAVLALVMGVCAFISLIYSDAEKTAATVGEVWIARINAESGLSFNKSSTEIDPGTTFQAHQTGSSS